MSNFHFGFLFDKAYWFDKMKLMTKKIKKNISLKEIEKLLDRQTIVILDAVDKRLRKTEMRINQKIEKLTTTLDKFLKRLTDLEDEFAIMKADLKRVKTVLKEKLGVTLD